MNKIENLLNKAYKNDKKISLEQIMELDLDEEEYAVLMNALTKAKISIEDKTKEIDNIQEEYIYKDEVQQYLREIGKIPLLTIEEEKELFYKYRQTGDLDIRNKIISANLRLVVSIAKYYYSKNKKFIIDFLDIIQDGNKGLTKAVDKFDVSLGYKFSTYATWWIRQGITKALSDVSRTIRIPANIIETYNKIKKYRDNQTVEFSDLEIAQKLGVTVDYIKYVTYKVENIPISLFEKVNDDSDMVLLDFVPSDEDSIEDIIDQNNILQNLREIMTVALTPKEYFVISCRFGLVNEVNFCAYPITLEQVGAKLGVTRERIRQIEVKALRKIKRCSKKEGNKIL